MFTSEHRADRPEVPESATAFAELLDQAAAGDPAAARVLYEQYSDQILRVLRRRYLGTHSPMRRFIDTGDVLQDTWRSVFERLKKGARFASPQEFCRFLLRVSRNGFIQHYRHATAARRDFRMEAPLELEKHDRPSREPEPFEFAIAEDEWRRLNRRLFPTERALLQALRDGATQAQSAHQLSVSAWTVKCLVRRARLTAQHGGGHDNRPPRRES